MLCVGCSSEMWKIETAAMYGNDENYLTDLCEVLYSQIIVSFSFSFSVLRYFCQNNCVLDQRRTKAAVLFAMLVRRRKK